MLSIGKFEVRDVVDFADQEWPAALLIPESTPQALQDPYAPEQSYNPETGGLRLKFGGFVFDTDRGTVLVDAGVGASKERSAHPDWNLRSDSSFLDSLQDAGYKPQDIDIVVVTHAHVDHVGWLTVRGPEGTWIPTFPRARYIFARPELEHWLAAEAEDPSVNFGSTTDSVVPLVDAGVVDLVDDGHQIASGVTLRIYPGHTPGNAAVWLESGGESAVLCGDTIHHPIQLRYPNWASGFCLDGDQSGQGRRVLLDEIVARGSYLMPGHFRLPPSRIAQDGDRYRWASS